MWIRQESKRIAINGTAHDDRKYTPLNFPSHLLFVSRPHHCTLARTQKHQHTHTHSYTCYRIRRKKIESICDKHCFVTCTEMKRPLTIVGYLDYWFGSVYFFFFAHFVVVARFSCLVFLFLFLFVCWRFSTLLFAVFCAELFENIVCVWFMHLTESIMWEWEFKQSIYRLMNLFDLCKVFYIGIYIYIYEVCVFSD